MRRLLPITLALPALGFILFALSGYTQARPVLDRLAADGSFEALIPALYAFLRVPLLLDGLALTGLAVWIWRRPAQAQAAWRSLWSSFPELLGSLRLERSQLLALLALTTLALVVRLPFLERPFGHDEAYTYVAFARRSVWALLSDYHLPNNHILHTLLVHLSTRLLGDAPWAVRLPALLAGAASVPAAYALGRAWFNTRAGLLAGGLLAFTPLLISASTDARGYTLLILFSLLCWSLATRLIRQPNPAGWLLLVLFGALGFFSVPVMLYPLGSIYAWMFLSALVNRHTRQACGGWLPFTLTLAGCGFLSGMLALGLYFPALLVSGPQALFANPFVQPLPWADFPATLAARLSETWQEWQLDVAPFLTALAAAGVAMELFFNLRSNRGRLPPLGGVLVWMIPLLLIQRPNAWRKTWYWLLALLLVLAAAGWAALFERIRGLKRLRLRSASLLTALLLAAMAAASLVYALREGPRLAQPWASELVAKSLSARLGGDEIVAVDPDHAPQVWYYLLRAGQPPSTFERIDQRADYSGVYVVTAGNDPRSSLPAVLAKAGPQAQPPDVDSCELIEQIPPYLVHRCQPGP